MIESKSQANYDNIGKSAFAEFPDVLARPLPLYSDASLPLIVQLMARQGWSLKSLNKSRSSSNSSPKKTVHRSSNSRSYKVHRIKAKSRLCAHHRPMAPPPLLPRLKAGEKVSLSRN
eukprot:scaffold17422_cov103-Cylindrotheca_fusiformis.AAC.1